MKNFHSIVLHTQSTNSFNNLCSLKLYGLTYIHVFIHFSAKFFPLHFFYSSLLSHFTSSDLPLSFPNLSFVYWYCAAIHQKSDWCCFLNFAFYGTTTWVRSTCHLIDIFTCCHFVLSCLDDPLLNGQSSYYVRSTKVIFYDFEMCSKTSFLPADYHNCCFVKHRWFKMSCFFLH